MVENGLMRAVSCIPILVLTAALAATGCVRSGPHAPARPTARSAAGRDANSSSSRGTPSEPNSSDCGDARAPAALADEEGDSEHTTIDDGFEAPPAAPAAGGAVPFAELTDAEISARLRGDLGALGSMSIGRAHGGVLVAGVRMPEGASWELVSPGLAWGTKETVDALAHAIDAVATRFPNTPKAFVGNLSARQGGHLPPHVSHQSGRDVDVGYYLTEGHRWYGAANGANLDRARTWHLVRSLLADSDVDLILIDLQLQRLLKSYALEIGEDPTWLDQIFQAGGKSQRPVIFHASGHATHLHVRFYSPMAQELGRRAYRFLLARRLVSPPTLYITHTVKSGETLSHLALRYKVSADAIKKANALNKDVLRVNKPYKIPQTGGIAMPERVVLPPRRAPPSPSAAVGVKPGWNGEPCRRASTPPG